MKLSTRFIFATLFLTLPLTAEAQWLGPMQGSPRYAEAVCFIDSLTGFVSAGMGGYAPSKTTDGGASWQAMSLPGSPEFKRFKFRGRDLGLAVGYNGVLFKTTDAGVTWTSRVSGTTDYLRDVAFAPGGGIWVCGDNVVLHSTDSGETWTANSNIPGFGALWSISFRTAQDGWAVGLYGRAVRSTDGGVTWNLWTSPVQTSHFGIRWLTSTRGVIITPWPILVSTDAGANWVSKVDVQGTAVYDLDFADSVNGWVVGQGGQLLHTTNGGDSWTFQVSPVNYEFYNAVSCISPRLVWAGGDAGVFWTVNGGDIKNEIDTRATLPETFVLEQNYPNPFNPSTRIKYTVGVASGQWQVAKEAGTGGSGLGTRVKLAVYDVLGREVAVLVDERQSVGEHQVTFDASGLPTGVYFCRLTSGSFAQTQKMVLLR